LCLVQLIEYMWASVTESCFLKNGGQIIYLIVSQQSTVNSRQSTVQGRLRHSSPLITNQ